MMDPIQRAVAKPPRKIVMQRAARRKVFWDVPPLAAGAQYVHHAVHDGPHIDPPLTAAASRGRDQRLDICPFVISQVARISQVIAVVLRPVLVRPQCNPLLESRWAYRIQVIQKNQELFGRTLSTLFGAVLGMRFKVFAVFPAIGTIIALTVFIVFAQGGGFGSTLLAIVLTVTGLEVGS